MDNFFNFQEEPTEALRNIVFRKKMGLRPDFFFVIGIKSSRLISILCFGPYGRSLQMFKNATSNLAIDESHKKEVKQKEKR